MFAAPSPLLTWLLLTVLSFSSFVLGSVVANVCSPRVDRTPEISLTPAPHGPLALPGRYTATLVVDGATYTQTLVLHNDPRVGESGAVVVHVRVATTTAASRVTIC
jgi:hypothetical protein